MFETYGININNKVKNPIINSKDIIGLIIKFDKIDISSKEPVKYICNGNIIIIEEIFNKIVLNMYLVI